MIEREAGVDPLVPSHVPRKLSSVTPVPHSVTCVHIADCIVEHEWTNMECRIRHGRTLSGFRPLRSDHDDYCHMIFL